MEVSADRETIYGFAECAKDEHLKPLHDDIDDLALAFDEAVCKQECARGRDMTEFVEDAAVEDEIQKTGLVFHRDEYDAARRPWPLSADDEPGGAHARARGKKRDFTGAR